MRQLCYFLLISISIFRLPGFRIGIAMLLILTSLSIGGITNSMCDNYFDFNLGKKIIKMFL